MKNRTLGRTGATISEIGFGAWQIGGAWGDVSEEDGKRALNAALDAGVTFIDTADVYGDGRSETFTGTGASLSLQIPKDAVQAAAAMILDLSRGRAVLRLDD